MNRYLQAVSVGVQVPEGDFRGRVHSVFHIAANIAVEGSDILRVLFLAEGQGLPQGIRLAGGAWGVGAIQGLAPGQVVTSRGGELRFVDSPYVIRLRGAQRYDGSVAAAGIGAGAGVNHALRRAAYAAAWDYLNARQAEKQADLRAAGFAAHLDGADGAAGYDFAGAEYLAGLARAARRRDINEASDSAKALVGLGGGLTPAGDDALVGFLVGLRSVAGELGAEARAAEAWIAQLSERVRESSRATNDISRSYLLLAAGGQFSSSLLALARAVTAGQPPDQTRAAADETFQVGHTSGMDAATGLLAGLAAWSDWA